MSQAQSALNQVQQANPKANKYIGLAGGSPMNAFGFTPHDVEMRQQQKLDKQSQAQNAADQSAVSSSYRTGPMALLRQQQADSQQAGGATDTGNDAGVMGSSLFKGTKKYGASRSLFGY